MSLFEVQVDDDTSLDKQFGSFSKAESYAREHWDKDPFIYRDGECLASFRPDETGKVWCDLTFAGSKYA